MTVLSHPDVELVVNLTIPAVHAQVSSQAIAAGKHVWSEKPISVDRESGRALLESADRRGPARRRRPDTVLGQGVQTARRAIARGDIGEPLSAQTVMQYPGPDIFHPNPEFLFAKGAGPLFDIGPYYLTALVHVFGPVAKVAAVGSRSRPTRTVQVGDRKGTTFPVEVPTHVSTIAQFASGGVSQSVFSFESPLARTGVVEITGTEGTLVVPDPNQFTGDVKITRAPTYEAIRQEAQWETLPLTGALAGRGTGVLDLARCIRSGSKPSGLRSTRLPHSRHDAGHRGSRHDGPHRRHPQHRRPSPARRRRLGSVRRNPLTGSAADEHQPEHRGAR